MKTCIGLERKRLACHERGSAKKNLTTFNLNLRRAWQAGTLALQSIELRTGFT